MLPAATDLLSGRLRIDTGARTIAQMARRSAFAFFLAAVVIVIAASTALAIKPAGPRVPNESGCAGITNAYSHVAPAALPALRKVAEQHGCDLSAVQPAVKPPHPGNADEGQAEDAQDEQDNQHDQAGNSTGPGVAAKCAKINEKLADASTKSHGKSADAFARQSDHWDCDSI